MSGIAVQPKISVGRYLLAALLALGIGQCTVVALALPTVRQLFNDHYKGACVCDKSVNKWLGRCTNTMGNPRLHIARPLSLDRSDSFHQLQPEDCSSDVLRFKAISSLLGGLAGAGVSFVLFIRFFMRQRQRRFPSSPNNENRLWQRIGHSIGADRFLTPDSPFLRALRIALKTSALFAASALGIVVWIVLTRSPHDYPAFLNCDVKFKTVDAIDWDGYVTHEIVSSHLRHHHDVSAPVVSAATVFKPSNLTSDESFAKGEIQPFEYRLPDEDFNRQSFVDRCGYLEIDHSPRRTRK
jgi:hypothetical protein